MLALVQSAMLQMLKNADSITKLYSQYSYRWEKARECHDLEWPQMTLTVKFLFFSGSRLECPLNFILENKGLESQKRGAGPAWGDKRWKTNATQLN